MSKTEALVARVTLEQEAREAIAFAKGQIARCHRTTIAHLMPKFGTDGEAASYRRGFQDVEARLAA